MERVKAIVEYASELQPEEREKFLQQVGKEDPDLLVKVRLRLDQSQADTVELPPPPQPAPGEPINVIFAANDLVAGRYRVVRFIAKGGMGEVYEVEDLELHSHVALKTISLKSAARPNALEMFRREILLARQVTHPNVCRIYDIGHHDHTQHGDVLFLTMELLQGETLAQHIAARGPLTKEEALPLLQQMIHALSAAHRLNIAHRDFKSGNVLLCEKIGSSGSGPVAGSATAPTSDLRETHPASGPSSGAKASSGEGSGAAANSLATDGSKANRGSAAAPRQKFTVKVTDFGLARSVDGLETTLHGEVLGTPDYMAPEQFRGQSSMASDIYSLGVVIYEMFTAELPHRSSSGAAKPDGKPSAAMEKIPAEWRPVVKKCMAYEPADRYATADDVWSALSGEKTRETKDKTLLGLARRTVAAVAIAIIAVIGLTAWLERDRIQRFFNPPAEPKHIAVLPFHNVGDDPANQAFCDGVAYSLSSKLSQLGRFQQDFWVIPADDARSVRNSDDAYRKLNADMVITGSVERTNSGAVVTINLVDARKRKQLASRVVTASMGSLDSLQDSTWESAANMIDLQVPRAAAGAACQAGHEATWCLRFLCPRTGLRPARAFGLTRTGQCHPDVHEGAGKGRQVRTRLRGTRTSLRAEVLLHEGPAMG